MEKFYERTYRGDLKLEGAIEHFSEGDMKMNIDLFNEVKRLKEELLEWETGQRQTSEHYNAYRARGVELFEKDQRIKELNDAIAFAINYLSSSDIGQVQTVVKSLKTVWEK
ncbi:hypothetical protein [uncultured Metabacillus sp.]|uniref:hypothetical protein n=1 Tax=uncultured Metabacillus sp. TaxID=2860135 RepID=UPI0026246ACE|nr:hypothetical protein [uncultured Metabacillus sp.]